jgi:hypothetical protein
MRISYLIEEGENITASRKKLHDEFLGCFPQLKTFIAADRRKTRQRVNIWHKSAGVNRLTKN